MDKKLLVLVFCSFLAIALVTAGIIQYFGQVQRDVHVDEAISFTGDNAINVSVMAGENVVSDVLNVKSQTSVVAPLSILTEVSPDDAGITNEVQYLLSASSGTGVEDRVYVRAEDAGVTTLNDLDSIEWEARVNSGYLPHVDVFLDNGETLVFEYAKVNPASCDNAPYPIGDLNTFDDKGIVNDSAYAWLSSGVAGPCGDSTFDTNHKSLSDWKTTWGDVEVVAFEIEIDNWIADSDSELSNILINGNPVEVSLKPSDDFSFQVETTFPLDVAGDYTITTTIDTR